MKDHSADSSLDQKINGLLDLSELAIEIGKNKDAEAVKVGLSTSTEKRLVVENMEYSLCNTLESSGIGVGVHKGQKKGSASTNSPSKDSVETAINRAVELSSFGISDSFLNISDTSIAPKAKDLSFLYDPKIESFTLEEFEKTVSECLEIIKADKRILLDRLDAGISISYHGMKNSNEVTQSEKQTTLFWSFLGMARDGDSVSGMDYESGFSFSLENYKERFKKDIDKFKEKVVKNLHPVKCPTYKGLVLFTPRAVEQIIVDQMLFHCSGGQIMDGKSKWEKNLNEKVTSDMITLVDRPHDPTLQGSTSFDSDGLPTNDRTIIENGILKSHLFSCYSAKKLNKKPNGMAGGPFGLHLYTGNTPLQQMKCSRKELLLVDRFSGNCDPLTGDFSGVCKSSRLLVDGKDTSAVSETMIAGNVFQLLDSINAVSKESEVVSHQFISPYVLCDSVSVTG